MIDVAGKLVNPDHVVHCEVMTTHYMNGSRSWFVVHFSDGSQHRYEHGYGFDAFKTLEKFKEEK